MLIRTVEQIEAEGRVVSIPHGKASAVRLLTKSDGAGFNVSEARGYGRRSSDLWYRHHREASYVRSGRGVLEDRGTGERWGLAPGVLDRARPEDGHRIIRDDGEGLRIVSVFSPPTEGRETHDEDGACPPTGQVPPGPSRTGEGQGGCRGGACTHEPGT